MNHTLKDEGSYLAFAVLGKPGRELFATFEQVVDPARKVVVDCSAAEAFLGDDIEDLVKVHNLCEAAGGEVILAGLPRDLAYVINLLSLDQFFVISDNVSEAGEQLKQAASGVAMTTMRMIAIQRDRIKNKATADVDPDEEARMMVEQVKVSMRYLAPTPARVAMLRFFEKLGPAELSAAETADIIGEPLKTVEEAFARLEGLRVLVPNRRGGLRYSPGPRTRKGIQAILEMWADEANRNKMMEWATTDADGDLVILADD